MHMPIIRKWHFNFTFKEPKCRHITVSNHMDLSVRFNFICTKFDNSIFRFKVHRISVTESTPQKQMAFWTPFSVLGLNENHYCDMWSFLEKLTFSNYETRKITVPWEVKNKFFFLIWVLRQNFWHIRLSRLK